jgi:hypothetical protein
LGTTVFGLRFLSAFSGVLSVLTAAWLGRTLLPRGGGALAALILAGLRWHLILSRWGWVMIAIAPLLDVAAILAIRSVRKRSMASAAIAGVLVGLAAHVYLAAWIAAAALLGLLLWPRRRSLPDRAAVLPAALYVAAFSIVVLPLFVLRGARATPYLQRVGHHNVLTEIRHSGSLFPPFAAAADALAAPWFRPDAVARRDLPGRSPLGWVLGIAVAAGIARSYRRIPGPISPRFFFPRPGRPPRRRSPVRGRPSHQIPGSVTSRTLPPCARPRAFSDWWEARLLPGAVSRRSRRSGCWRGSGSWAPATRCSSGPTRSARSAPSEARTR